MSLYHLTRQAVCLYLPQLVYPVWEGTFVSIVSFFLFVQIELESDTDYDMPPIETARPVTANKRQWLQTP